MSRRERGGPIISRWKIPVYSWSFQPRRHDSNRRAVNKEDGDNGAAALLLGNRKTDNKAF
jgi:hypothetical protein